MRFLNRIQNAARLATCFLLVCSATWLQAQVTGDPTGQAPAAGIPKAGWWEEPDGGLPWEASIESAMKRGKELGRPVFLAFNVNYLGNPVRRSAERDTTPCGTACCTVPKSRRSCATRWSP